MTIEITRPETEALIQRYLQSGLFHDIDELLARALGALEEPETPEAVTGKSLAALFEPVRGLLTDEEIDTIFSRNPSTTRPIDLS